MSKVLIVEDNPDHADLARRVLAASGYDVLSATDAEAGLQMAIDNLPDLILLDLGLPDIDGQTLLGRMRRVPELKDTPIVAVTAWPANTGPRMAESYGFDGYISKPLKFSKLAEQVSAYLSQDGA